MNYSYDKFGWYVDSFIPNRTTDVEPNNKSTSETEGLARSNWTGHKWIELPYKNMQVGTSSNISLADYDKALTNFLDDVARTRHYADRISCAVRAGYPGPFQAEGIAFATWMDTCNATGYQMLDDFHNGLISQPSIEDMLNSLPEMAWP